MKNTLAENMLRFGSKNLDAKAVANLKKLAEQAPVVAPAKTTAPIIPSTVSKIPEWSKMVVPFFKKEFNAGKLNTSAAIGRYLYVAEPTGTEGGFNVAVYQATPANVGWHQFLELNLIANVPTDGLGNLKDTPTFPPRKLNQAGPNSGAAIINSNWNNLPLIASAAAVQHVKNMKPYLTPAIDQIKKQTNLAALGTELTGIAKAVYNEILS
jgi:hypothetical protein